MRSNKRHGRPKDMLWPNSSEIGQSGREGGRGGGLLLHFSSQKFGK